MPRHAGLPRPSRTQISRSALLATLEKIDADPKSRARVLTLETGFRKKIDDHVASLPSASSAFDEFNTSPFVLLIHARQRQYSRVSELERDILPAKQFSSMETSAGRMVEEVVLPVYGWECVPSQMHSPYSAIDGKGKKSKSLLAATLKSGPRCLNDEMSENLADAVLDNFKRWADDAHSRDIEFTYGVLYGTKRQSNKKDWHILRNIAQKTPGKITDSHENSWTVGFLESGITVKATVRVGLEWWEYLGGPLCFAEVMTALIRSCVAPGPADAVGHQYSVSDLGAIVSTKAVREGYNVSLLQKSQIPWLFLMARHYCDDLVD